MMYMNLMTCGESLLFVYMYRISCTLLLFACLTYRVTFCNNLYIRQTKKLHAYKCPYKLDNYTPPPIPLTKKNT